MASPERRVWSRSPTPLERAAGFLVDNRRAGVALCWSVVWTLQTVLPVGCDEPAAPKSASEAAPWRPEGAGYERSEAGASAALRFTDVTGITGVDFRLTSGASPTSEILEAKGGGLALIDFDNDRDPDIFLPNGATLEDPSRGPGCRLFENLGELRFRDATVSAGLRFERWGFGVAAGDADGDGFDDLYVACYGPNALLRNTGDGRFVDATDAAGVGDDRWGTAAAFLDFDRDRDLDLYVVNYLSFSVAHPPPRATYMGVEVMGGPRGLSPQADVLYENVGGGRFVDVTQRSGMGSVAPAYGLNVVTLDFDGDGWIDILVANDSRPNFLLRNLGDGRFEDIGIESGVALNAEGMPQASMGIAVGDVDGNGFPDVFTTNFASDTNTLQLNLHGRTFVDRTHLLGLGTVSWTRVGWACAFEDFDLDGDEDLFILNGHVYPEAETGRLDGSYAQAPLLLEKREGGFRSVSAESAGEWLSRRYRGRAAAFGDLDGDGDVDVVLTELNGPVRILRNDRLDLEASWLVVELSDERPDSGNRRGIGARVRVQTGSSAQVRWIHGGGPFQSASETAAFFGFREPPDRASIEVKWPDGHVQRVDTGDLDRRVVVHRAR